MKTKTSLLEEKKKEFEETFGAETEGIYMKTSSAFVGLDDIWSFISQAIKEAKEEGFKEGYDQCDKGYKNARKGSYEAILRKNDGALFIKTHHPKSKPNK